MTLKEFLEYREHRFDNQIHDSCSEFHKGYMNGWHDVCHDILLVLKYHGFDLDQIIVPD